MSKRPLAVSLMPLETRYEIILHTARKAEELGYEAFFLPETWGWDAPVLLADLAARTERIRLGPAVLGVWGRSAAAIAMAAATANITSGGRFTLGLGASSPQLAHGWHDVAYRAPYSTLRRTLLQVRALLAGERLPMGSIENTRPLRLNLPPQPALPIYLAATAPRAIRLAAEHADGWFPAFLPRDRVADAQALIAERSAERALDAPCRVCPFVPAVVDPDPAKARRGAAWVVAFYLVMMGEAYRGAMRRWGYGVDMQAILDANADKSKSPSVVPESAEAALSALAIYGAPDDVAAQVGAWYEAGADMPVLMLNPRLEPEVIDLTLEAFARG